MRSGAEWEQAAKKELAGKDPKSLSQSWGEFKIFPYYQTQDLAATPQVIFRPAANTFGGPNGWFNLPAVEATSVDQANSGALQHLRHGGDGVSFKIDPAWSPAKLLNEVEPEYCLLLFESENFSIDFFQGLANLVSPTGLKGAIFCNAVEDWLPVARVFKGYTTFRCLGITENGKTAAEQILSCLKSALDIMDALTDNAFLAKPVFDQLAFTLHATQNFFGDVIKVRALRLLLQRLAQAYDLEGCASFIRMKIYPRVQEIYEPHGDLLSNGIAAIAAVVSSVDAITVVPAHSSSALDNRTARNISLLLKDESKLDKVIDPLAGSYFVESVTNALVEKVWEQLIQGK